MISHLTVWIEDILDDRFNITVELKHAALLCTGLYWYALFRQQTHIYSSQKNKGKLSPTSLFIYIGIITGKFIWVECKPRF